jgi:hypothetical protein
MLRGLPHLAKYMPEIKDARRLIPDPESELDFESISKVFPLPDAQAAALELALTLRNSGASIIGGSGLQQQFQGATNNNWAAVGAVGVAGMLPAQQANARANDAVAAALHLEAELGAQDKQNVALLIELAALRQQAGQQANSGNAVLASLVESMLNPPSRHGYK